MIKRLMASAVLAALTGTANAAAIVIDAFTTNQQVTITSASVGNPSIAGNGLSPSAGTIGNARRVDIQRTTGSDGVSADVNINTPGAFAYGTDPGNGGPFSILWDGGIDSTVSPTGLGGVDLVAGTNDRFRVAYQYDLGLTLTLTVYSSATDYSSADFAFSGPNGFLVPFNTLDIPFSSFTQAAGATAAANFASVGAIVLSGNSALNPGADFRLDFLQATNVPEIPIPAALPLLLSGLAGLGFLGRRKRAA